MTVKPRLTFSQIINMNVGFFGIQYSFGLQQSAVNPIYDFLGPLPTSSIVEFSRSGNGVVDTTDHRYVKR